MKKLFIAFFLLISITGMSSCKKFNYNDLDSIVYENLLSLSTEKYVVICYQSNCSNCEKMLSEVKDYYKYTKKNDLAVPIYGINLNLSINKDMLILSKDTYPSNMLNTTNYKNVKVKSTPCILVIEGGKLVKIISDYSTNRPVTEGKQYLKELMEK